MSLSIATPVLSCEAATQTERRLDLATVTLRRGARPRASRCRPHSLIDYRSYMDTKLLVARFLEQSSCSMTPDIHELVEDIKSVLKSDEGHMEEAITSASFLEQVLLCTTLGTLLVIGVISCWRESMVTVSRDLEEGGHVLREETRELSFCAHHFPTMLLAQGKEAPLSGR